MTINNSSIPWARIPFAPDTNNALNWGPSRLSTEDLIESYERQSYRITLENRNYLLKPRQIFDSGGWDGLLKTCEPQLQRLIPEAIIVGLWHPDGIPVIEEEQPFNNLDAINEALDWLRKYRDFRHVITTTVGYSSEWVEPSIMLIPSGKCDMDWFIEDVLEVFQQPACVYLTHISDESGGKKLSAGVAYLDSGDLVREQPSIELELLWLPKNPCPMSCGYQTEERPTRVGGPFGRRAMVVAGLWQNHYTLTHRLLSCTPCGVERKPNSLVPGAPVSLQPIVPSSRYGYTYHYVKRK
jgi:hypothetical protein